MHSFFFSKWYTRLVGIYFVLIVFPLLKDFSAFGFHAETMHKIFHIVLGAIVLALGWKSEVWWKIFPIVNGLFFSYVALFGWLFPDFGALEAFNRADTILHTIVGLSGLIVAVVDRRPRSA